MGALTPGSAHARPSAQAPINARGIFLAQVSEGVAAKKLNIFQYNQFRTFILIFQLEINFNQLGG